MTEKSIMIVGVGDQGSLLASRLMGNVLLSKGYDVKVSEVHGMSQRGGSVVTYVKYGDEVFSPVIEKGEADVLVAFEQLEAARWVSYLKDGGHYLTSTQKIAPMPVITGAMKYPDEILEKIKEKGIDLIAVDALKLAEEVGNSKTTNVVMMGVLASKLDFPIEDWKNAIKECVPEKFYELNIKAFELGLLFSRQSESK